jgi:hypothetical protein
MPYVSNYETILKENNVQYDIINWDRLKIEEMSSYLKYRDSKNEYSRNFFDYWKYKKFIINYLNSFKYNKIIVFGLQLTFFLKSILIKKFEMNYIIDIRDYNKICKFYYNRKVINHSSFTVLSSPGFKKWLPNSNKYVINHNTQINDLHDLRKFDNSLFNKEKINIAYIGSIRDYKININFINSLKNSKEFFLLFHGEGIINKDIMDYLNVHNIKNVSLTGRYLKKNEENLYLQSDLINILIPNNDINSITLLPNRLYNAVLYGKPVIAFEGTYLADQVKKYNLGIVLNNFQKVEDQIKNYLSNFDTEKYQKGRLAFFDIVIKENREFHKKVEGFLQIG